MSDVLDIALKSLEKEFGRGAVLKGDEASIAREYISTGSLALDKALGNGLPMGSVVEVYGTEGAGKTTLALHAIAEAQKRGMLAAFIDVEHALSLEYASSMGIDITRLYFAQPTHAREALTIVETLLQTGEFGIIVVDSIAALITEHELEGNIGDTHVAPLARLMSQFLKRIAGLVRKNNSIVFFINQIRMNVGVMFGNPETTPGGKALKYYATVRLDVRIADKIKQGADIIGNLVRVKVIKNKVAPPFKVCQFNLIFGSGIDTFDEIITYGIELQWIAKGGAWYTVNGEKVQGRAGVVEYLTNNPDVYETIKEAVLNGVINDAIG